jgi:predicted glycoside hydrolase/deacetylase ChbG (UPF0249 family)
VPSFLIVNADDFNLTEGVTRGILEAHLRGIVTSTSVMVNLPGLERGRELAREAPRLGLGLHLTLTFGSPVLPAGKVASLVDGTGAFIRDRERVGRVGDPQEVREELAAQAARFEATFGARPTHLDTHHHVHRHSRVFDAVLDLATALGLPLRALTPEMAQRIRERHLPAVDQAVGDVGPDAFWHHARLADFLRDLPAGVTELMCHPGYADGALSASSYRAQREVELRALCDSRVKAALTAADVQCITYGGLAAVLASR